VSIPKHPQNTRSAKEQRGIPFEKVTKVVKTSEEHYATDSSTWKTEGYNKTAILLDNQI